MLKNRIKFIGIGQCGNNIVAEFDKIGYSTIAINTSDLDLKSVEVENKYRIPNAYGCARDRKKAVKYLGANYSRVFSTIEQQIEDNDLVYVVFSLGGGTGSGMSPLLIDALSRKHINVSFSAICVVPSLDESIQAKANAIEAYNEVTAISNLRSLYLLDNNLCDKIKLNGLFTNLFNSIVNMSKPNKQGVIDDFEIEKLLTTQGNSIILGFDSLDAERIGSGQSIFVEPNKDSKFIGVSVKNEFEASLIYNEFGEPQDVFRGYNEKDNIIIATGMSYPMKYFSRLDEDVTKYNNSRVSTIISEKDRIDTSKYDKLRLDVSKVADFDFGSLFDKYVN